MPTYSTSYSDTSVWSTSSDVYRVMDDYKQLYYHDEPKKKKVMGKKNSGLDLEKMYEKLRDKEIVKLLESMDKPPEDFVTPIILLVPNGSENTSIGYTDSIAIQKKHPSVVKIVTITDEELENTQANEVEKILHKNFIGFAETSKLSPMVVMLDVFTKNQNTMSQSILMKMGNSLLSSSQKVLSEIKRKSKAHIRPEPLIIVNNSFSLDDIEEAATLAGVTEMEEIREDNLSYIKLTF